MPHLSIWDSLLGIVLDKVCASEHSLLESLCVWQIPGFLQNVSQHFHVLELFIYIFTYMSHLLIWELQSCCISISPAVSSGKLGTLSFLIHACCIDMYNYIPLSFLPDFCPSSFPISLLYSLFSCFPSSLFSFFHSM